MSSTPPVPRLSATLGARLALCAALLHGPLPALAQDGATSDVVVIQPGRLHRFAVTAPAAAVAGESFELSLEALDAQGNRITDPAGIDGEFRIEAAGRAQATPATLTGAAFQSGVARVAVRDERAETITLLISSRTGTVLGQTREIRIAPGELDRFVVRAPSSVTAGLPARVDIEAEDRYGNRVLDLGASRELLVTSDGTGIFEPGSVPAAAFQDGRATFAVVYRVAETVRLTVSASGGKKGSSGAIAVAAAPPHHFALETPRSAIAGKPFPITLRAFDAFNNLVRDFARVGGDVALARSGEGAIEPRAVEVARFNDGSATVPVTVFQAGTFRVRATARGGEIANESEVIRAEPGEAARFAIENAASAQVKEALAVKLVAFDAWGNAGATLPGAVRLSDDGGLVSAAVVPAASFERGVAYASVTPDRVGRTGLVAALDGGRARSAGPVFDIGPGDAARLEIAAPPVVIAGEPFEVLVTVYDRWDNVVTDFDIRGRAVSVTSRSDGPVLLPYRVLASQFERGRAHVQPVIEKAGRLRLEVQEEGGRLTTASDELLVRTARPDHFLVRIPPSATAGQPFDVTIEARDRFGNRIGDYDRVGQDVRLEVEGQGKLDPSIVPARSFRDGFATMSVTYDRAERLVIRPRFASQASEGGDGDRRELAPLRREPRGRAGESSELKELAPPVTAPPVTAIRETTLAEPSPAAPPARTETRAVTRATPPLPRPVPQRTPAPAIAKPSPAREPAPRATTTPAPMVASAATPALPAPPAAPPAATPAATPRPSPEPTARASSTPVARIASAATPPPVAVIATPRATPPPVAVRTPVPVPAATPAARAALAPEPRPARRGEAVTVKRIRFEEEAGKITLRIEAAGALEAKVAPEFRYGTEWIAVSLSPVANDLSALLGRINSKAFGTTEVKSDDRTAILAFELLAERIDYHVASGPDGVTVTFTRANGNH